MRELGERSSAMRMWRERGLGSMRTGRGAPVLLGHTLTVGVVMLRVGCRSMVLGDRSNLRGETAPCPKARTGVVGEVLEQQRRSVGIGTSGGKKPSDVLTDNGGLTGLDGRGPVVEAGK